VKAISQQQKLKRGSTAYDIVHGRGCAQVLEASSRTCFLMLVYDEIIAPTERDGSSYTHARLKKFSPLLIIEEMPAFEEETVRPRKRKVVT
jgi:hypothetical protein